MEPIDWPLFNPEGVNELNRPLGRWFIGWRSMRHSRPYRNAMGMFRRVL